MNKGIFNILLTLLIAALSFGTIGCSKDESTTTDGDTMAQQVASVMADIDESGGSSGGYAMRLGEKKMFARHLPKSWFDQVSLKLFPSAEATSPALDCDNTFSSCSSNVITRDFSSCTIGSYTFDGTVELTFTDATVDNTCSLTTTGHAIKRNPDFTIKSSRGGTFTVEKIGANGQTITLGASPGEFNFSNDGIKRTVTYAGRTIASYTTVTTSDISITGATRNGRIVDGGNLKVTNELTGDSCDFVPNNVTWDNTCNCPVSGSWTATCGSEAASLTISSCTSGVYAQGGETQTVAFDRCNAL